MKSSEPMDARQRELEHLRLELARAQGHIDELRTQLEVHSLEPTELRAVVQSLEQQLLERDEELEKLRETIREGDAWRRDMEAARKDMEAARQDMEAARQETVESLSREIDALRAELELFKSTRLWRAGKRYWAVKARIRAIVRRGAS
jgi:chromosome segregation ATPase